MLKYLQGHLSHVSSPTHSEEVYEMAMAEEELRKKRAELREQEKRIKASLEELKQKMEERRRVKKPVGKRF